jgi:predicted HNH restriction endonuclease
MHSGYTDQQVRDELAKCVCLCRRCHEGVHQNLRDYPF